MHKEHLVPINHPESMAREKAPLNADQEAQFERDGVLILKGFYDLKSQIEPIQRQIYEIIGLIINKYGLSIKRSTFSPERFDSGFQELIRCNRSYGAEVYDAVKQIPAFVRLVSHEAHDNLFRQLRKNALPGVAGGGYGVRIDNPEEDKFRAGWHQEYPAQLRSLDGVVFWSPLVEITDDMGPVQFAIGSHIEGPVPVYTRTPGHPEKTNAYGLILKNETELLKKYQIVAPLTRPGDLVVIDFLLLHASGFNQSPRSRWSLQSRFFNFSEPTGISHAWSGSFAQGVDFRKIHPELCADED